MRQHSDDEGWVESAPDDMVNESRPPSLSALISPDDWRLYHIMRELHGEERLRVLAFAEMLYNLQRAREWAKPK